MKYKFSCCIALFIPILPLLYADNAMAQAVLYPNEEPMIHVTDCMTGPVGSTHVIGGDLINDPETGNERTYIVEDHGDYTSCEVIVSDNNYDEYGIDQWMRFFVRCVDPDNPGHPWPPTDVWYHPADNYRTDCAPDPHGFTNNGTVATIDCQRRTDNWLGHIEIQSVRCLKKPAADDPFRLHRA